jgi:hypothetical protein
MKVKIQFCEDPKKAALKKTLPPDASGGRVSILGHSVRYRDPPPTFIG